MAEKKVKINGKDLLKLFDTLEKIKMGAIKNFTMVEEKLDSFQEMMHF